MSTENINNRKHVKKKKSSALRKSARKTEDKKSKKKSEDKKSAKKVEDKKSAKKAEDKKSTKKAEDTTSAKKADNKNSKKKAEDKKSAKKVEDKKSAKKVEDKKPEKKAKDKKSAKKAGENKSKKKAKDKKSAKKAEDKKSAKKPKHSGSKKSAGKAWIDINSCSPGNCLDLAVAYIGMLGTKVASYQKQTSRFNKSSQASRVKSGKQLVFNNTLNQLILAGGGNVNNITCGFNTKNSGTVGRAGNSLIRSFAHRSFAHFAQIK